MVAGGVCCDRILRRRRIPFLGLRCIFRTCAIPSVSEGEAAKGKYEHFALGRLPRLAVLGLGLGLGIVAAADS